jgi:hypothetical protein
LSHKNEQAGTKKFIARYAQIKFNILIFSSGEFVMRKFLVFIATASTFIAATPVAMASDANTATYDFNECLAGACGSLATSIGSLTLSDVNGGVSFSFLSKSNDFKSNSFISGLFLNGPIGAFDWTGPQSLKDWDYSRHAGNTDSNARGYNWDLFLPAGGNHDRFLSGETATWTISGNGIDISDFINANKFVVHLNGLGGGGNRSAWIGAVAAIPEPETYAMLLAGLIVISVAARRRTAITPI